MEAISKKNTGHKFTGNVAALMVRIGVATPVEIAPEVISPVKVIPEKISETVKKVRKQKVKK